MIINSTDGAPILEGADRKALLGKNRRKENCGKKTVGIILYDTNRKAMWRESCGNKTVRRKPWEENLRKNTLGHR